MIIDIGSTIIALMGEPITVKRSIPAVSYTDGFLPATLETDISMIANVQPARGDRAKDVRHNAEGERIDEEIIVTTLVPLIVSDTEDDTLSDYVEWHGKRYRAISVEDRLSRTNHFHTRCVRDKP